MRNQFWINKNWQNWTMIFSPLKLACPKPEILILSMQRLHDELYNSILHVIPHCGHIPHVEKPKCVAESIVRFVTQVHKWNDMPSENESFLLNASLLIIDFSKYINDNFVWILNVCFGLTSKLDCSWLQLASSLQMVGGWSFSWELTLVMFSLIHSTFFTSKIKC